MINLPFPVIVPYRAVMSLSCCRIGFLPMGRDRFLLGRKPFFMEETPKGHRVCDNNQLI